MCAGSSGLSRDNFYIVITQLNFYVNNCLDNSEKGCLDNSEKGCLDNSEKGNDFMQIFMKCMWHLQQ